jgi:hypothetical protein
MTSARVLLARPPSKVEAAMRGFVRSVGRSFNWDVVIRLALVPVVSYVLFGAAMGESRRAAHEAARPLAADAIASLVAR